MKVKKYVTKQTDDGRWKFGVPSILRRPGRWSWTWALSLRTFGSKASAARAARRYLGEERKRPGYSCFRDKQFERPAVTGK